LILHFTCLVPLAYLLGIHFGLGLSGVWGSAVVYVVLLTAVMSWKFWKGDWQHIKI
jgi:MATE family multidrug resistance protein